MGIIQKQGVLGSLFSYLGVGLGFITIGLIWPKSLKPEQIGLINLLLAQSLILSHIGSLGINSVILKLFPYFRDKVNKHNGLLFLTITYLVFGTIIIVFYVLVFREKILQNNAEKSNLFNEYYFYLIPFTLSTLIFNILDSICKAIYKTVIGIFSKDFFFRILNLILIIIYLTFNLSFKLFILFYTINLAVPIIILTYSLLLKKEFDFKPKFNFITKSLRNEIINVSLFAIIGGLGTIAIANIDKIMINRYLGLESTGIYSIAFLFASVISLPARPLSRIATTIISDSWKQNKIENIHLIYHKTCLNLMIIGSILFVLIWMNIDQLFLYLPEEYKAGKYVILFIALSGLVEMTTGVNGMIIATSKYYKYQIIFIIILCAATIGFNIVCIPRYGINGAAFASLLSTFIFNFSKYYFLLRKFKMSPIKLKHLNIIILPLISIIFKRLLINSPTLSSFLSIILVILFLLCIYFFNVSEDINNRIRSYLNLIGIKVLKN